ncbi:MAG: histidine kinase, partial [Gammaproteobacteria bacterium]|nr:histidine kinase [Gammaproteobacteria bacterium]
ETVERCETRYESRVEQRVEGYRVRYEYGGRQYRTRLPYDPGERMRVQVSVVPAGR